MAQDVKDNRIIIRGEEARAKLLEGAKAAYDSVTTTFGPKGQNVLIEKTFGRPLPTRDGVTVARDTYFKDRPKNMGAQLVLEASETTNRIAGDGTTATVGLSYGLIKHGNQAIAAGTHPMELKDQLITDSQVILDTLEKLAKPTKKGQLQEVATVSSGSPILGQLIAEAIDYVGADGGIITEKAHVQDIEREYVDGYYLQTGFTALQAGRKEMIDPLVVVLTRRLTSSADANEILTKVVKSQGITPEAMQQGSIPRILFVGDIEEAAYNFIVNLVNRGVIDAIIIKTPPIFGAMGKDLLEDIAVYADCEPVSDQVNLKDFDARYVGSIDRIVSTKTESTLFSDNSGETIKDRVNEIKDQIKVETVDAITEKLKDRVAKLEGKIALFKIGGATESEKEEKEFRIEDAIQATRAAFTDGIVAGGGITLLELSKLDISEPYRKALRDLFCQLLINANLPAELKLDEALKAPKGHGFNLREGGELVNMVDAGILDPKLVVEQVIRNATSAATIALTTGTLIVFEDKD